MDGKVVGIFLREAHGKTPRSVSHAKALLHRGLDGDLNGKKPSAGWRQVLLVHTGDLAHLGLKPGDLREQLTVDLPDLMRLPGGTRLEAGGVVLEVTRACDPCTHVGGLLGRQNPAAFQEELVGRRGMFASVVEVRGEGRISVGATIRVRETAPR